MKINDLASDKLINLHLSLYKVYKDVFLKHNSYSNL